MADGVFSLGLGAGPVALWLRMDANNKAGAKETAAQAAKAFGVDVDTVRRWRRDLRTAGALSEDGELLPAGEAITFKERRRCSSCRILLQRGEMCSKCKRTQSRGEDWHNKAIRIARIQKKSGAVNPVSIASALDKPLWKHVHGANELKSRGVVAVLLEAGLLEDEWRKRQTRAEEGYDADG